MSYRVSPSAICSIVRETMLAICESLQKDFLPKATQSTWIQNEEDFAKLWNFPNSVGAIDGKHVRIKAPAGSGSQFFNYKNYFSVVLLAIVNAKYQFTLVNIGSSGSQSDGGILLNSKMQEKLDEDGYLPPPKVVTESLTLPHVILGDDGFPLRKNLLKPYPKNRTTPEERIFNYRLSRARLVVENAFGILAARWRIFHSVIEVDIQLIKLIIRTAVILHNFTIARNDWNGITTDNEENGRFTEGNWRTIAEADNGMIGIRRQGSNNRTLEAVDVRNSFKDYFSSQEGSVVWQNARVNRGLE